MKSWWMVGLALLVGQSAHASVFGEENAALITIARENIHQTVQMAETLEFIRQTTEYARDTAAFARESVQVAKNLTTILKDPAEFAAHLVRGWSASFPELQDVLANAKSVRESIDQATHPETMGLYDPYAYVRAFDGLHSMAGSGFEVWAQAIDNWGVNEPHDEAIKALQKQHDMALQNLEDLAGVINSTGLSPVQASIYTAQATTVSATAQVEAAATLQKLNRTAELMVMGMAQSEAQQQAQRRELQDAAVHQYAPTWRLLPMKNTKLRHAGP